MSLANKTTLLLLEKIRTHNPKAALIFMDIKSAFDSISNQSLLEILEHIFPNSPIPDMIHSLSSGGEARVDVNHFLSQKIKICRGCGQGDPLSSCKYNCVHEVFTKLIHQLIKKYLPQTLIELPCKHSIDPTSYADDNMAALQITSELESDLIRSFLLDAKIATGLQVNPIKSEIITPNPDSITDEARLALKKLGTIVNCTKHLGLTIGRSYAESYEITWTKALSKFSDKVNSFTTMIGSEDIFHKRMLCGALIRSTITHILRVFPPSQEIFDNLEKLLIESLWSKRLQGVKYGRHKIAKLELPVSKGGINWKGMESHAFTSFLSSFFHTVKFILNNPTSNLARLIPIDRLDFFRDGSSSELKYVYNTMKKLFPISLDLLSYYKTQFTDLLAKLEMHKDFFHLSYPIYKPKSHPFPFILHALTKTETQELNIYSSLGSLLARQDPPSETPGLPSLAWDVDKIHTLSPATQAKLCNLLPLIRKHISPVPSNNILRTNSNKNYNFLYSAVFIKNSFFTKLIYRLKAEDAPELPPAYQKRIEDKAPIPTSPQMFSKAYTFLHKSTMPTQTKSFILDILNRTAPSKRTLCKMRLVETDVCARCPVVADNYHVSFECDLPYMAFTAFSEFFKEKMNNLTLTEDNFCFFVPFDKTSFNLNSQFLHLFGAVAHLSYSIVGNNRFGGWGPTVLYAKILTVIDQVITVRKEAKWAYAKIVELRDFFITLLDQVNSTLTPSDMGHFRAQPTYSS